MTPRANGPERREWTVEIEASEVRDLADKRAHHHRERLTHWLQEEEKFRDAWVESVREAAQKTSDREAQDAQKIAEAYEAHTHGRSSLNTVAVGGRQIQGDQETLNDLQRATAKVQEHRAKVDTYTRWVAFLSRALPDEKFDIDIEDAHFFDLKVQ